MFCHQQQTKQQHSGRQPVNSQGILGVSKDKGHWRHFGIDSHSEFLSHQLKANAKLKFSSS